MTNEDKSYGQMFEIDIDTVLKEHFEAGEGVVQIDVNMPDAAILLAIKQASKFGKPFMVIPLAKS